ncbi:MAG: peptidoglycan-binding protein [Hyphomicrobiaceae bacterium]|nr:peptidoglycan-binding protein [Hyphomicrobiaceae bacterium]
MNSRLIKSAFAVAVSALFFMAPANLSANAADHDKPKNEYNITINYELGMHCTGFDFTYCCVLPPYNSVQSQVIKTATGPKRYPELLEADPKDPTVVVDGRRRFKLEYGFVDNTYSEGAKLSYWNVPYDVNGDGKYTKNENVANAYFTHLYVYKDLKGSNPKGTSKDSEKAFVGLQIPIPQDNGPAGAAVPSPIKNGHLHYTGEKGTIVFTKSPVLDNVPIMLTNPGIWDALGLPLTPFNDSTMTKNPLNLVESDIRPFQENFVKMVDAKTNAPIIDAVSGKPVHFVGTNPIDIPNCSNCHANQTANGTKYNLYKQERAFWKALGASDWIANLKATSISIMELHDDHNGTNFLAKYDPATRDVTNRLGRDPVLCQKCHADNVIGVLQSASYTSGGKPAKVKSIKGAQKALNKLGHSTGGADGIAGALTRRAVLAFQKKQGIAQTGRLGPITMAALSKSLGKTGGTQKTIPSLAEALHTVHQQKQPLADAEGRTGACQGCHPAHRQSGDMKGYPITLDGKNAYAKGDNRDAYGGCYVGRDVHANPNKDKDGVETSEHLNAIGEWLKTNVSQIGNGKGGKGLWCTNCHNQLSRELYQRDNLINAFQQTGKTIRNKSLDEIASALGVSLDMLKEKYMDPKVVPDGKGGDDPEKSGILLTWAKDRMVPDIAVIALKGNGPMVTKDADGDINVTILSANPAVDIKSLKLPKGATGALAVPYSAATHGKDYWLSAGSPHCADCHAAPYVEGQGGAAFPINQPGKYSLMRYSKGHAGLSCQSCHQSTHGLYPVVPIADTTTYAQAPQYNPDGSHGPFKCAACHVVNESGVPLIANKKDHKWNGANILYNYEAALSWMHGSAPDLGGAVPSE